MSHRLHTLLHLVPGEAPKVALFAAFGAVLQAGMAIGLAASDSLFLANLGAARLSIVYISMPVVMACFAPCLAVFQGRFGVVRTFYGTLAAIMAGGLFFGLATNFGIADFKWLPLVMKLYTGVWFISLYTLFWNFSDDFFSILDGKRMYGIIAAGSSGGGMLGAALVPWMTEIMQPAQLFVVWGCFALAAAPLLFLIRRKFRPIETEDEGGVEGSSSRDMLRSVFGVFRSSRYALGITAICFCGVHLSSVLEYLALGVLSEGKSATEMAALLGKLHAIANGITLVTNLVLFNRIVGRLGVNNTVFVLPVAYLISFVFFYLNAGYLAALVAFYAYQSILTSIEYNNINLLFNALPAMIKRQVRTFIEAMCEPLATALAGVFLLARATEWGTDNIALWGLIGTAIALTAAAIVRNDYLGALSANLRRDWLDFAQSTFSWRTLLGERDREILREKASSSPTRSERFLSVDLMGLVNDPKSPEALYRLVEESGPDDSDKLRPSIRRLVTTQDPGVVARTLLWLESPRAPEEPELLDEFSAAGVLPVRHLSRWVRSRHPSRIAMAAISRWHSARIEDTRSALEDVRLLLAGSKEEQRWGVRALGTFRHTQHARELRRYLDDSDRNLRIEALRALHRMASPESIAMIAWVMPLVADSEAEERALILGIVAKVGDEGALPELMLRAEQFSAAESRQLESLILEFGLKTIPALTQVLRRPDASSRTRCLAARALGRLAPPQLEMIAEDIMAREVALALSHVRATRVLSNLPDTESSDGLTVLRRYYRDHAAECLDFILQLLSLVGRLPDFELIRASLAFANPKDRANAIETIEQSCSRSLYDQLMPIIEATAPRKGFEQSGVPDLRDVEVILDRATQSQDPLECLAAHYACEGLGLEQRHAWFDRTLAAGPSVRVARGLLQLAQRAAHAGAASADESILHEVQKVAALVRADLFADSRILALDFLAGKSDARWSPRGERLFSSESPSQSLLLVVRGEVQLNRAIGTRRIVAGEHFNERVLMGSIRREEIADSLGSLVIMIPAAALGRAIKVFPALGISLYRVKIVSAVA